MNNSSSSNKNNIHKSRLWFLDLLRAVAKRKTQLEAPCMYGEQETPDKLLACLNRSLIENKLVEMEAREKCQQIYIDIARN